MVCHATSRHPYSDSGTRANWERTTIKLDSHWQPKDEREEVASCHVAKAMLYLRKDKQGLETGEVTFALFAVASSRAKTESQGSLAVQPSFPLGGKLPHLELLGESPGGSLVRSRAFHG
ncbi:hypothetical protein MHYP_G00179410 [Metynnis hypsauchen]